MANKHVSRSSTKRSLAGKRSESGITNALVDAAVEIGHAAEHIKSSLEHVAKAGEKGKVAIEPMQRAGKKAVAAVRKRIGK